MPDDILLTLHCPQCKQITDVVTEGENLVCLDCGWRFDDKIAARFINKSAPETAPITQPSATH